MSVHRLFHPDTHTHTHTHTQQQALYTAAWFKIYLNQDKGEYYDLIFGDGNDSVCKSQEMKECEVLIHAVKLMVRDANKN